MLKDFQEKNLDVVVMAKDTDRYHIFEFKPEDSRSTFVPTLYNLTCEVRLCSADIKPAFLVAVGRTIIDGKWLGNIKFDHYVINSGIREDRLYWRVIAENKSTFDRTIISRGKIYLTEV